MKNPSAQYQRKCARPLAAVAVVTLLLTSGVMLAQTPEPKKSHSIFDDDYTPPANPANPAHPNQPDAHPAVAAPAQGLASGLIGTVYGGITTDARVLENHIVAHPSLAFRGAAKEGHIPLSFSFRGSINVPAGGIRGKFHFTTTGDTDILIDNMSVSAVRRDDPASSVDQEVNLAAGLHSFSAVSYHMHSDGQPQRLDVTWAPAGGVTALLPRDWCWHARADEPADTAPIHERTDTPANGGAGGPSRPDQGWVPSGTARPVVVGEQLTDLLPQIVLAEYAGQHLERLHRWRTHPVMGVTLVGTKDNTRDQGSFRMMGLLKLQADSRCIFTVGANAQVIVTVDGNVVTRTGFAGDTPVRKVLNLQAGNHVLELSLAAITRNTGRNPMDLQWSINNLPYATVPPEVLWHYRSQEPYGDGATPAPPPAPEVAAPAAPLVRTTRLPIPDAGAQAKAEALMRQRFAWGWSSPATAQQADSLIRAADHLRDDPVASYVVLKKAAEQAQAAASLQLAFSAIEQLSGQFNVDSLRLKVNVLQGLGVRRMGDPVARAALIAVFDQAMGEANFPIASDAATLSLADARQGTVAAEIGAANQRLARASAAMGEWEQIKPMLARAADNPNDAAANLAIGRFYCFTARNWRTGAAALARCGDPVFSWLGRHEAAASQGPEAMLIAADGWWNAADAQTPAVAAAMRERAAQWYGAAAPNLVGMSRRLAASRAAKVPSAAGLPSPLESAPAAPDPVAASGKIPVAPPSADATASAPPAAPVAPHGNAESLFIVIDRAELHPNRLRDIAGLIRGDVKGVDPTMQVTIILADAPATVITFTAADYETNPALSQKLEDAMHAAPPASDLEGGVTAALDGKPQRLHLYLDGFTPIDKLARILRQRDPNDQIDRYVHLIFPNQATQDENAQRIYRALRSRRGGAAHDLNGR